MFEEGAFQSNQFASPDLIQHGDEIIVDGELVGFLVVSHPIDNIPGAFNPPIGSPEQQFLNSLQESTLLSIGLAILLALVLGFCYPRSLTRPIRVLIRGTKQLAKGELGSQVHIRSQTIGHISPLI